MKPIQQLFMLTPLLIFLLGCPPPAEKPDSDDTDANVTAVAPPETLELSDGLTMVKLEVPGMMCAAGCPPMVKSTLARCEGVDQVIVDFDSKTASPAVAENTFDADGAVNMLVEAGFADSKLQN